MPAGTIFDSAAVSTPLPLYNGMGAACANRESVHRRGRGKKSAAGWRHTNRCCEVFTLGAGLTQPVWGNRRFRPSFMALPRT